MKVGKYSYLALLMTPLVATGCAPKNESALIYSSAMSGGLNLQTPNITDGQIKITLGYATTDFAYVPVAAGYGCEIPGEGEELANGNRINSGYCKGLTLLNGDKNDEKSDESGKRRYDEAVNIASTKASILRDINKQYGDAVSNLNSANNSLASIDAATRISRSSEKILSDRKQIYNIIIEKQIITGYSDNCHLFYSPENLQKVIDGAKIISTISTMVDEHTPYDLGYLCAFNNAEASKLKVDGLSVQLQKAEQAEKSASEYAKILATYTDANSRRTDAYSVFGTFEHNGTASPAEGNRQSGATSGSTGDGNKSGAAASLTAGKIFATGIAAQNLTEGIQAHLQHACVEELRSVASLVPDEKVRSNLIASLVMQCLTKTPTVVTPPPIPATPPLATPPVPPSTNQPSAG